MHNTPSKQTRHYPGVFGLILMLSTLGHQTHAADGCGLTKAISKSELIAKVQAIPGHDSWLTEKYIKDVPGLGFVIGDLGQAELPDVIRENLGRKDGTHYPDWSLFKGSFVAVNHDGKAIDMYPMTNFEIAKANGEQAGYLIVSVDDVFHKNKKLISRLTGEGADPRLVALLETQPQLFVGILKTAPTPMVRMSNLGFAIDQEVRIKDPWGGEQTKPAGADAWLVWDTSVPEPAYYMVNAGSDGLPATYTTKK